MESAVFWIMNLTISIIVLALFTISNESIADVRLSEQSLNPFIAEQDCLSVPDLISPHTDLLISDLDSSSLMIFPAEGRISSSFGSRRDPIEGDFRFHAGFDIAGREGAIVRAALGGEVIFAGSAGGCGNMIEISHSADVRTRYCHLRELLTRRGEFVAIGDPIGKMGSTGRSTGTHLHFEIRRGDRIIDPARDLMVSGNNTDS